MFKNTLIYSFFDKLPLAIALHDLDFNLVFFNQAAETITGYSSQELLGKSINEVIYTLTDEKDIRLAFDHKMSQFLRGEIDFIQAMLNCQRKNGTTFYAEINLCYLKTTHSEPEGILFYARDISQEEEILKLQSIFPYVFNSMRQSCIVIDKNKKITHFNREAEDLLQISREEAIGKTPSDIYPIADYLRSRDLKPAAEMALEKEEPILDLTVTAAYGGEIKSLLIDAYQVRNEEGEIIGAMSFSRDITLLRNLEKELQIQEKLALIGQLAAATAHEIRNPLTVGLGFLELLKQAIEKETPKEKQLSYMKIIKDEMHLINKVIKEFLWLGKEKKDEKSLVEVNKLLNDILPILESEAIHFEVGIKIEIEPELPPIEGNPEQLKQVFFNLIQNAFQALKPQEGNLKVKAYYLVEENKVCVTFTDNGPGISLENIEEIFQPFFTTKETGSGLGLFICKRILERHKGEIKVKNNSKGGSVFIVTLPIYISDNNSGE